MEMLNKVKMAVLLNIPLIDWVSVYCKYYPPLKLYLMVFLYSLA